MRYIIFFICCFASSLLAETTLTEALKTTDSELKAALKTLEKTRAVIASEKPSFSEKFHQTEAELLKQRRLVRIAQQSQEDRSEQLKQLRAEVQILQQDAAYTAGLLKEHALKLTTLATPGSGSLKISPEILAASPADPAEALLSRLPIIEASFERMNELIGGSQAKGSAADEKGVIHQGQFLSFGPFSYFINQDQSLGGDVRPANQGVTAHFRSNFPGEVSALLEGKESVLPLDPTKGNAFAMQEIDGGFSDLLRKGGLWIWPIIFLALLSLIFGVIKLLGFSRLREPNEAWITTILATLRSGDREKAISLTLEYHHPAAQVMHRLVSLSDHATDLVEETLYEQLMSVQAKATSMLAVIGITAATSPLLGLLGTVSGMISTFNLITIFGSGDPKPLAGGISEALVTTLFGLIVAIPALILHAFLSRRANGIVQTTERLGLSFINGLRTK